jgi:DNA repair exonuclease SbcCD ATPase subunit
MQEQPRYLKKVQIRNFQSHRDTEVHLVPGINLIVGTSDIGKSAFMRALNLAMHNEVPNREFVTYGEKDATVILEFSDGTVVERVKGSTKNAYYATLPDGTRIEKEKLGNTSAIPEEIFKALGSPPIDKKHGPLAYADQHSPLFLVSLTPTELPRCISELTGLDDYETAALDLAKNARRFDRKVKEVKDRITSIDAELEQYQGLDAEIQAYDEMSKLIDDAEAARIDAEDAENRLQEYNLILEQGRQIIADINEAKKVLVVEPDFNSAKELESEIDRMLDALSEHSEIEEQIDQLKIEISNTGKILESGLQSLIDEAKDVGALLTNARRVLTEYNSILAEGLKTKTEIAEAEETLTRLIKEQEQTIEEFTAAGLLCPECKQPIAGVA